MIYMFLANGFEEVEALCPLDLMRRVGIEVKTVGIDSNLIAGAHGITVMADTTIDDFDGTDTEMIFLPGGMPGTLNLAACNAVINAINEAYKNNIYIAAICAAPSILGDMGLLRGKEAICYPGFEGRLTDAIISEKKVVVDGKIITAAGMGAALEMGLAIVSLFCGKDVADKLRKDVIADQKA